MVDVVYGWHVTLLVLQTAVLGATIGGLWTQQQCKCDTSPFDVSLDNVAWMVLPSNDICIDDATGANCNATVLEPGLMRVYRPVLFSNGVVMYTPAGADYTVIGTLPDGTPLELIETEAVPFAFIGQRGAVLGSRPSFMQPGGVTVVGTPGSTPTIQSGMWASTSGYAFVDPGTGVPMYVDHVCHSRLPSMCGALLRTSATDAGFFWSPTKSILGQVDDSFVTANTGMFFLVGGSMAVQTVVDLGTTRACVPNPSTTIPYVAALYLSQYAGAGDTCSVYHADFATTHAVQTNTPLLLATLPNVRSLLTGNTTRTCVVAAVSASNVTITAYSDVACTSQPSVTTYPIGVCVNSAYRWIVVLD